MDPAGAKAIVTGGAAGIGRGIAELLASHGGRVVIADYDDSCGKQAAQDIGATFVHADVTRDDDLRHLFDVATRELGGLNVLVNNAGGVEGASYPSASSEQWFDVLDLNLRAVMFATQLALERMAAGVIVNIGSVAALGGTHTAPEYAAAKAGVVRLTTSLPEHGGVRLVCVCPDSTRTPAMERTLAEQPPGFDPGPMLEPRDVGAVVVDLIRDDDARGRVVLVRAGEPAQVISG